jgi:hypothetical protein
MQYSCWTKVQSNILTDPYLGRSTLHEFQQNFAVACRELSRHLTSKTLRSAASANRLAVFTGETTIEAI